MEMMIINDWLEQAKKRIDALDVELIALAVFAPEDADRSWLIAHGEEEIFSEEMADADDMVKRRFQGEPLAYILEEREFFGRMFQVNPDVLIPRVDTETLIYLVESLDLPARPRFLEIGTGSGCIAITLALEYPQASVVATDVSREALAVAELNDTIHEGRIDLLESDLLHNLDPEMDGCFDVLVANLPYVDMGWDWLDMDSLQYEPGKALFAKEGGLAMYHRLLKEIQEKVTTHNLMHHAEPSLTELCHGESWIKYLVFEADPCQHDDLIGMADAYGWKLDAVEGYGLRFKAKALRES